ncbi:MAG: hypothetical protein ABL860_08080 [Candidatus Nitrotoga sp.]
MLTLTLALIYTAPMPTSITAAEYMKLSISEHIQPIETSKLPLKIHPKKLEKKRVCYY